MEEEKTENKQSSEETSVESPSEEIEAIQPSGEMGAVSEDESAPLEIPKDFELEGKEKAE